MNTNNTGLKICCFGELLLRFSPGNDSFREAMMPVFIGGAELNVSTALAKWGLPVKYVTAVPDNYLSQKITGEISVKGIDISSVLYRGDRIGLYYLPQGADMKNSGVIYDRTGSSFAGLKPGDINWDKIFNDVSWLHVSAISPALNKDAADVCLEAVSQAASRNITVSIDLNYRARLWQNAEPIDIIPGIVDHCNVVMGNIWSAEKLLGLDLGGFSHDGAVKETYLEKASVVAKQIKERFQRCEVVANTFRFDEGDGIRYFASLSRDKDLHSATYATPLIIDKVGSGDCFMAGLIYGLYHNNSSQDIIEFAAAAAFGKLQEKGDVTSQSTDDIRKIILNG